MLQASGVPIERYSFETVETMKDRAEIWKWRRDLLVAQARLAGATEEEAEAQREADERSRKEAEKAAKAEAKRKKEEAEAKIRTIERWQLSLERERWSGTTYAGALLTSYLWGWTADRYGSKPVMVYCVALLPLLPLGWLLMPRQVALSLYVALALAVFVDRAAIEATTPVAKALVGRVFSRVSSTTESNRSRRF